jgi:hypothetical protein
MNDAIAPDFFDRLERELREAAGRRPRRSPGALAALAAAAVLAVALVPLLAVLGGGRDAAAPAQSDVGSFVERGGERHRIVATGENDVAGRWQLETHRSSRLADSDSGEVYQPAGLRCLGLYFAHGGGGGQCGEFPRTPGFSRVQDTVWEDAKPVHKFVYGRAPERATAVVVRRRGELVRRVRPIEGPTGARGDFYFIALPVGTKGRVNWLDRDGREGSRGIELLPP